MDDRQYMAPRFHSPNVKIVAARDNGRLIGSGVATRWGSFGFFGPLTVLPEYWGRGVAQQYSGPPWSSSTPGDSSTAASAR